MKLFDRVGGDAMSRRDELTELAETFAKKYGRLGHEVGFEFLALHTLAMEPEFADEILNGNATEQEDLSEFHSGKTGDLQIDSLIYNSDLSQIAIIQTAYSKSKGIDEARRNKIKSFFDQFNNWLDPEYVASTKNSKVKRLIQDAELGTPGQRIRLYFVTSFSLQNEPKLYEHAEKCSRTYSNKKYNVECLLIDGARILKLFEELKSTQTRSLVDRIDFDISPDLTFIHDRALVTAIKGNQIAAIYNRTGVGFRLFNSNIRLALRETNINRKIRGTTHSDEAGNFFIYNNGITATCSEFSYDGKGHVTARNLQVVNGAQTVYSLSHLSQNPNDKVYVLLRLIETDQFGKHKNEIADKITRFQNTQNPIKLPDFKSNDPIQIWLRDNLSNRLSGKGANIEFWYCHKRGYEPSNTPGIRVTSEDLGKIRHAFLHGPKVAYKEPKTIWDESNNDAVYWEAFGKNSEPCTSWSDTDLAEVGWALRTRQELRRIKSEMKRLSSSDQEPPRELKHLEALAIYIMSLVAVGIRKKQELGLAPSFTEIMATTPNYHLHTKELLNKVRGIVRSEVERSESVNIRQELPSNETNSRKIMQLIEEEISSSRFE